MFPLTSALGKFIVAVGALVTVGSVKVWLAGALAPPNLAHITLGPVDVTLARDTARVSIVTNIASVAETTEAETLSITYKRK